MPDNSREGAAFFLNVPEKLNDPFPELKYFRENRPVFYYPPLKQWFLFRYDDVSRFFTNPRLSADRMKGFVDAAPELVRPELRTIAPYLEKFVLMNDEPNHARIRKFLHLGFNTDVILGLRGNIQQIVNELLDRAQPRGRIDAATDFAFLLPAYVLSDLMGFPKQDRHRVLQWSLDFIGFFNNVQHFSFSAFFDVWCSLDPKPLPLNYQHEEETDLYSRATTACAATLPMPMSMFVSTAKSPSPR